VKFLDNSSEIPVTSPLRGQRYPPLQQVDIAVPDEDIRSDQMPVSLFDFFF
jgi:hypothetical protein